MLSCFNGNAAEGGSLKKYFLSQIKHEGGGINLELYACCRCWNLGIY